MQRRTRCLFVFIVIGFITTALLMRLNLNALSFRKSKAPVLFNPDVFIVTFDNYSNSEPPTANLTDSRQTFNPHKIYPWKNDPSCQHISVQMAERNSLPKWALTSFPGSGVTWTRQMIEGLTGIYTGSVHKGDPLPFREYSKCKPNLENMFDGYLWGFNYRCTHFYYTYEDENMGITDDPFCNCTIIDKDHEATQTVSTRQEYLRLSQEYSNIINATYNYRGVLLLRNPMDVVIARQNHLIAGKFKTAPLEAFRGPQWDEMVETVAYAWADHATRWIDQIKQGTVIFYESLVGQNAKFELERLLNAMNFEPRRDNADRMRCTLAHRSAGEYKRSNKTRIAIEKHHHIKFMRSINRVQQSLRKRKWPQLPVHLFDSHLPITES